MPAFVGGPLWPELDTLLASGDLPGAALLAEQDARIEPAERQLIIGICCSMTGRGEQAVAALSESLRAFAPTKPARAAVAGVPRPAALLRIRQPRGRRRLRPLRHPRRHPAAQGRRTGPEHRPRRWRARARVGEGLQLLDEAMTMVLSGEAGNPLAAVEVVCGDVAAAQSGSRDLDRLADGPAPPVLRARSALARLLAGVDTAAATDAARSAHLVYDRLGAPVAVDSAALLTELGVPTRPRPRPADATAVSLEVSR